MSAEIVTATPPARRYEALSESPSIWLVHDFLSHAHCDHLVSISKDRMQPSLVMSADSTTHVPSDARTSSLVFYPLGHDPVIAAIETGISEITHYPVENGEGLQVLNYKIGQEYKPHYDFFNTAEIGGAKAVERGGQRAATVLIYLNDVEEGGETTFPNVDILVRPTKGMALLFYNLFANGEPDRNTLHGSVPVARGEKWVATKWIRLQKY